ncbi:DNA polymerase III subunit delta [Desulfogranum japonicum]|uniref:DNA polymerase III subunit delta n=1 Tax=Desulfogranum japonicum TaxID=231447 RepID=UPI0004048C91|nr:DNA polymerase III subunit delta [Desulfogranum japonicum]
MAVYTRENLPTLFKNLETISEQAFLVFGERYLCQETVSKLETMLLNTSGTVHPVDGEQEDIQKTLNKVKSFSLLPGRQIFRVMDTRVFHSKDSSKSIWTRAVKAHGENKPDRAARALLSLLKAGGIALADEEAELAGLSSKEWSHYFGFTKPDDDLSWTSDLIKNMQSNGTSTHGGEAGNPEQQVQDALQAGFPQNNILFLISEEIDKRKKLYKYFKENHTIIDLSVETGASSRAQKTQKAVLADLMKTTLAQYDKALEPRAVEVLYERVGFHPVALVNELRKLVDYTGETQRITLQDVDAMVGRTRQEAIFELTTALTTGQTQQVLTMTERLQENGIHPLAIIASLRNFARSLLLFRALSLQPETGFTTGMSAQAFQNTCLPVLKERETWKKELSGHPYALYMQFKTASSYSLSALKEWMEKILQAEMRLKSSALNPEIVLQHLLIEMMRMPRQ